MKKQLFFTIALINLFTHSVPGLSQEVGDTTSTPSQTRYQKFKKFLKNNTGSIIECTLITTIALMYHDIGYNRGRRSRDQEFQDARRTIGQQQPVIVQLQGRVQDLEGLLDQAWSAGARHDFNFGISDTKRHEAWQQVYGSSSF